jgi:hypothetical protein
MKPELVSFFRHIISAEGMDTSLGGAKRYFKTLTPDAVKAIVGLDADKQQLYNNLEQMLERLVWTHGPHWTVHQYIPPSVIEVDMSKKKKVAHFRIIGDVHGKYDKYAHKAAEAEYSFQVGDMGFDYRYLTRIVDSDRHKIIGGNHDNYTKYLCVCNPVDDFKKGPGKEDCPLCGGKGYVYGDQSKHFLGDYGTYTPPGFQPIFYVRGAWSIDFKYRTPEISWWEDEEIPYAQMTKALAAYTEIKPDFVVTHTAPFSIVPSIPFERIFGNEIHKPRTETLLDEMYDTHQPKVWVFGHWHVDWDRVMVHPRTGKETRFICLAELSHKDFPKEGEEVDGNK